MITEEMIEKLKLTDIEESAEKDMLFDRVKDMMASMVIREIQPPMIGRGPVDGVPTQQGNSFFDFQPPNKFSKPSQNPANLYSVGLIESLRETSTSENFSNVAQFNFGNNQTLKSEDFLFGSHKNDVFLPSNYEPWCMQTSFTQNSKTPQLNFDQNSFPTPNFCYKNNIQNDVFMCSSFMVPNPGLAFQNLHGTHNGKLIEPLHESNQIVNKTSFNTIDAKLQNQFCQNTFTQFPNSANFKIGVELTPNHQRNDVINNNPSSKAIMNGEKLHPNFYELEKNIEFLNTNINGDDETQKNKCDEKILINDISQESNYVINDKNNNKINQPYNNKYTRPLKQTTEKEFTEALLMHENSIENIFNCSTGNYDNDNSGESGFDNSVMKELMEDLDKECPSFFTDEQIPEVGDDLYDLLSRTEDQKLDNKIENNDGIDFLFGNEDSLNKDEDLSEVSPQSISTLSSSDDLLMYVQPSKYQDSMKPSLTNGNFIEQADFHFDEPPFPLCDNYDQSNNNVVLQHYPQQQQQQNIQQQQDFLPELEINDEDFGFKVLENLMLLSEESNKLQQQKVQETQNNYEQIHRNKPTTNIKQNDFFITNNLDFLDDRLNSKTSQGCLSLQQIAQTDDAGDNLLHQAIIHEDDGLFMNIMRALEINGNKNNVSNQLIGSILNSKNHNHQTPLIVAVLKNKPLMLQHLLNKNLNPNQKIVKKVKNTDSKKTFNEFLFPVHVAASRGNKWLSCLKELLSCPGIQPDLCDSNGDTALHLAVRKHQCRVNGVPGIVDNMQSIEALVSYGADILKTDLKSGMNAFHISVSTYSFDISHLLLKLALQKSSGKSHKRIVSRLVSVKTGNGNTALHLLASLKLHKKPSSLKPGLSYQNHFQHMNYNHFYNGVYTPVNHPMINMRCQEEQIKDNLLMEKRMNERKENLLIEKKIKEQIELVQALLKNGADPSCKNSEGFIPRELTSNSKIVDILKGRSSTKKLH